MEVYLKDYTPFAFEVIAVGTVGSETGFSTVKYRPANGGLPVRVAHVMVDPGPMVRFTLDGTTVTSTNGHQLTSFMQYDVIGFDAIKNFKSISAKSATGAQITVTYFR